MLDMRLKEIRNELKEMADKEAMRLWRIARNLQRRGGSQDIINDIREEANQLHMTAYPERLISWDFEYKFKYAFKY